MTFTPTAEQERALSLFTFGDNLAVEAGAGTGKTSTLRLMAESTDRAGQYVAFNRPIVEEAKAKMPENVRADTMHSLAMRAVGRPYRHRLEAPRQPASAVARQLGIPPLVVSYGTQRKVLQPGFLASLVQRAITVFCQTADPAPNRRHVPYQEGIDPPDRFGRRTWANNDAVRDHLAPYLDAAWADLSRPDGRLRFRHEHYLKLWQLSDPKLPADFILFDEAQDASPVMLDVVSRQDAQLVFVGDSQQQIYEFTGAVNALAKVPASQRTMLTRSFRFGPAIAGAANTVLDLIDGADLRLVGDPDVASRVGPVAAPHAILTRTNATAVHAVLDAQRAARRVHLVGGGTDVLAFAEAAGALMAGDSTWHPELACFTTWGEVQDYVEQDPQGSELALLVKLVDEFGVETIRAALRGMEPEHSADLVVSTAHKAKGREWDTVALADDFPDPRQSFEALVDPALAAPEFRLLYVAATRARLALDATNVELFTAAVAS